MCLCIFSVDMSLLHKSPVVHTPDEPLTWAAACANHRCTIRCSSGLLGVEQNWLFCSKFGSGSSLGNLCWRGLRHGKPY